MDIMGVNSEEVFLIMMEIEQDILCIICEDKHKS